MIERIVLFKLKDEYANDAARREIAAYTADVIGRLPGVKGVSVGVPADPSSAKSWDLSVVVRFDSMDDVRPYAVHADHRKYVDEYMRPRMEVVKAWNFSV